MPKAYAYVRVSLEEERPENQRLAIEQWARLHGYEVTKWFEDIGVSGAKPPMERPGFKALLEAVKEHPLPVLAYELSRIGRSFYEVLQIVNELERAGSPIITVSPRESFLQSLDPQVRKLVIAVLAWAAEWERELLRQRTKEGMRRAQLEGKHIGRPKAVVDLKRVEQLRSKGLSLRDMAKLMGISYSTLLRRLKESKTI